MNRNLQLIRFVLIMTIASLAAVGCHNADNANPLAHREQVSWSMASNGSTTEDGRRTVSGEDGMLVTGQAGGASCIATTQQKDGKPSIYIYYKIGASPQSPSGAPAQPASHDANGPGGPIYAAVEYFDSAPGDPMKLEYDSMLGDDLAAKFQAAEQQKGGKFAGTQQWSTALFRLNQPRFAGRQNLEADFRLEAAHLFVRSVTLTHKPPQGWDGQ